MNRMTIALLLATLMFGNVNAYAHGEAKAKFGGVVAMASDLSFELVATSAGATIYIEDHDKPLPTKDMSGKLTVLTGKESANAVLKPIGDNKLDATGIKLMPGSKVVASINLSSGKAVSVRFVLK